ncbi:MAG: hypothetical protein R2824_15005 [Saprospiraceae bacterium]|nr:hypothetical protein [Lewinella sp.]
MRYLIGPEFIMLLIYVGAILIAKANVPPVKSIDNLIENCWLYIPLLAGLSFGLWWVPGVEKDWLLLRVWVVSLLGGHFAMEKVMSAYSDQGPGIGMSYLVGMMFLGLILVVGTVLIRIKF